MSISFFKSVLRDRRFQIGAVLVVLIGGYFYMNRGGSVGATLTITPGDFTETVSVSGTVTAAQDVMLGFAANGRIAGTYARVGQHVGAGAVIAEIENGDLFAALSQKKSALAQANANLASLMTGTRPEEVAVAATAVANAKAVLANSVQNAYSAADDAVHNRVDAFFTNPRTQPKLSFSVSNSTLQGIVEQDRAAVEPTLAAWALLVAKVSDANVADSAKQAQAYMAKVMTLLSDVNLAVNQGVPDQSTSAAVLAGYVSTLSTARSAFNAAATTLVANSAALDATESTLTLKQSGSTPEAINAQEAVVAAAEADVRAAAAQLQKTQVVAPFSGTVTRMDAKVGEIVAPTTSEISMQSDGIFQIETYIPEVTIARVAPGNAATTTLDAYGSGVAFSSTVISVDPAETMKDGVPTYKTVLSFLTADARIRSGMTANVAIETGRLPNAIVIPSGAVGNKSGAPYVSVVAHGVTRARTVTTGPAPALGQALILSGLSAGEVILLAPAP